MVRNSRQENQSTSGIQDEQQNDENQAQEISAAVQPLDGFTEDSLRVIDSFEAVLTATGGAVANAADVLGTGYTVLETEKKMQLLDRELMIVKLGFHKGDKGNGEFATLHILTREGGKFIINDSSTGIYAQVKELKERQGTVCPMLVPRGLRVSEYDYTDPETQRVTKAKTFYLNTSK